MDVIYQDMGMEDAIEVEQLSRLMYELRTARKQLLESLGVDDDAQLLDGIRSGKVPEHPGYEQALSAHILGDLAHEVRSELAQRVTELNTGADSSDSGGGGAGESSPGQAKREHASLHLALAETLNAQCAQVIEGKVEVRFDALLFALNNGVSIEARFAAPDAYALNWSWKESRLRIDTAPIHHELESPPSHLHGADGRVGADPVTHCGAAPWSNLQALIGAVLADPLLGGSKQ